MTRPESVWHPAIMESTLISKLLDESWIVRRDAVKELGEQVGKPAVELLIVKLQDEVWNVRAAGGSVSPRNCVESDDLPELEIYVARRR